MNRRRTPEQLFFNPLFVTRQELYRKIKTLFKWGD